MTSDDAARPMPASPDRAVPDACARLSDTPDAASLLAVYDSQLRGEKEMENCVRITRIGPVFAGEFSSRPTGFASYETLDGARGDELDRLIDAVIAHFEHDTTVTEFEWKTRGHDAPGDLADRLVAHGFVAEEPETVMMGEAGAVAASITDGALPDGVVVRQVGQRPDGSIDPAARRRDLERAHALQAKVFGHDVGGIDAMEDSLDTTPDAVSFWIAEADGDVVSAGRITVVPNSGVAGIWGGATDPAWRGRGIYRVLTAARAEWALERGVRYLHSDSTDESRPILERSGLVAVTTTTPYVWSR